MRLLSLHGCQHLVEVIDGDESRVLSATDIPAPRPSAAVHAARPRPRVTSVRLADRTPQATESTRARRIRLNVCFGIICPFCAANTLAGEILANRFHPTLLQPLLPQPTGAPKSIEIIRAAGKHPGREQPAIHPCRSLHPALRHPLLLPIGAARTTLGDACCRPPLNPKPLLTSSATSSLFPGLR